MNLLEISYIPAVLVSSMETVKRAVAATVPVECDAMTVTDHGQLKGILTPRDVMLRVVLKRRDPHTTLVRDVMTRNVVTFHPQNEAEEALELMLERNFRHLPLSEDGQLVCGMLSLRNILKFIVEDQRHDLEYMEAFLNADSPGG